MTVLSRILRHALKVLTFILGIVLLVWSGLALNHRVNEYKKCAALPNGLLIGHAALIDPKNYLWQPNIVLKLPNGITLIPEYVGWFDFSKTTVYGHIEIKNNPERDIAFLYRADTGLIFETNEPKRYEALKNEAGPLLWMSGKKMRNPHGRGLMGTYYNEIEKPTYDGPTCILNLLP